MGHFWGDLELGPRKAALFIYQKLHYFYQLNNNFRIILLFRSVWSDNYSENTRLCALDSF